MMVQWLVVLPNSMLSGLQTDLDTQVSLQSKNIYVNLDISV